MSITAPATYRFRAECEHDVFEYYELLERAGIYSSMRLIGGPGPFPDCDVEVVTGAPLAELVEIARLGPDLHVIAETLARAAEYTGVRAARKAA